MFQNHLRYVCDIRYFDYDNATIVRIAISINITAQYNIKHNNVHRNAQKT